jgi:Domain of unknown function (DUF6531)
VNIGFHDNMAGVGAPIATNTGEEYEDETDWVSPREPRLAFPRHYSSSETYSWSVSGTGYGMAWWSPWEKRVVQTNTNTFSYYDDRNNWYSFSSTSTNTPIWTCRGFVPVRCSC